MVCSNDAPSGLSLSAVSKNFGEKQVLCGVELHVRPGELITLLGPSGCGKSTALKIIGGFEQPTSGRVSINDVDVTDTPARRRGAGIVFQQYSLFPHLTAEQNVEFGLKVRRIPRQERKERVAELLDLVGLVEHSQKYPHQLSGGQQQRIALARALVVAPAVLLLDEPLSALDAIVRDRLRDEIVRIHRERGTTTIMVTHDQEEALAMSDRVAVMHAGRIVQLGTPQEIYRRPESSFVADFIGTMNRVTPETITDTSVRVFGNVVARSEVTIDAAGKILIRPEDLRVVPGGASGKIVDVTLRGGFTSLYLDTVQQVVPLRVDIPTGRAGEFRIGEYVGVGLERTTRPHSGFAAAKNEAPAASLAGTIAGISSETEVLV
ncbi:ABC transporter ATP-binding protein [Leucobacter insecticola]|uniref:ABC-type quaternary amine transporter n=1 Tax=Leucobacter insecticola TaxID=2714934 RepID=A0A6G8FH22_9MICO|nr:ABC transporter ATP-binding protein [Leucobacter insecticola]QIM15332.1 ABC transporter ATP-binding protein [Leucobacter insecticola]